MVNKEKLMSFEEWLNNNINKEISRKKYYSAVKTIEAEMLKCGVIKRKFDACVSISDFNDNYYNKIIENESFKIKDDTGHHMYKVALNHYKKYLFQKFQDKELLNNDTTWKSEIVKALKSLGGKAHVKDIFNILKDKGVVDLKNSKTPERTMANILQTNSLDTDYGTNNTFYSVNGIGKGIWGLTEYKDDYEYNSTLPYEIVEDVLDSNKDMVEGQKKKVQSFIYERNPKARQACINHFGAICQICGCDMGKIYGKQFLGKIHVHHKVPLNEIAQTYKVDPIKDLIPVCPNCHMILHCKKDGYYTPEQVKLMLKENRAD